MNKTSILKFAFCFGLAFSSSAYSLELSLNGDGSGGKALGLITTHKKIFFTKDIADTSDVSIDLKSGERIYEDEILGFVIKPKHGPLEKYLMPSDGLKVFKVSSGGDSGGG